MADLGKTKKPSDPRTFGISDYSTDLTDFVDPKTRGAQVNVKILSRAPAAKELGEGETVFAVIGGVRKMFVKLQGTVVSTTLT